MQTEKSKAICLRVGLGLVLGLITAMALIDASITSKFESSLSRHYSIVNIRLNLTNEMLNSMTVISQESRTILLLADSGAKQESYRRIEKARVKCDEAFANLKSMENDSNAQALLARLGNALNDYNIPSDTQSAPGLLPGTAKIDEMLKEVVRYQEEHHKMILDQIIKDYHRWHMYMLLFEGITLVSVAWIAILFARSRAHPERKPTAAADKLSPGEVIIKSEASTTNEMELPAFTAQKKAPVDPDIDTPIQSDEDILTKNLRAIIKTGSGSGVRPLHPPR